MYVKQTKFDYYTLIPQEVNRATVMYILLVMLSVLDVLNSQCF
jgi:hypothetical protein